MNDKKQLFKLRLGKNKIIDILFDPKSKNKKTIEMVKTGAQKAFIFFDDIEKVNFSIDLVSSRLEFDEKMGFKTEDWFVGNSFGNKFMIFNPETIEKQTSHKKGEFIPLITHETTHVLHKKINRYFSHWLSEGIAQNIARQKIKKDIDLKNLEHFLKNNLFKNSDYNEFIAHQGYEISNKLVGFFIRRYTKEQVMQLLKIRYDSSPLLIEKKICKILKIDKDTLILSIENEIKRTRKVKPSEF